MSNQRLNIAIVGGGPGCLAVLRMFQQDKFREISANVVGVADVNPQAAGLRHAADSGIFTTTNFRDLYRTSPDLIIELTGSDAVLDEIIKTKPPGVKVMDHVGARLFWDFIQAEEERLAAREELERTKNFLETIYNGIRDNIMVLDRDLRIVDVNEPLLRNLGFKSKAEVVGRHCYEVSHNLTEPCVLPDHPCPARQTRQTGAPSEVTHAHVGPEGQTVYHRVTTYPLRLPDGSEDFVVEITRDITRRVRLEQSIRDSEEKFHNIVETATEAIISVDSASRIVLFNRGAEQTFGYGKEEVLGRDLSVLVPEGYRGPHRDWAERYLGEALPHEVGKTFEAVAVRQDGREFPMRMSISVSLVGGSPLYTAIIRDQTERRELNERLLMSERLAAIGRAAAYVGHEIKNPLMIIGGFADQLLRRSGLGERDAEKLRVILNEVRRLETMLAEMRDFTRPTPLKRARCRLNDLIEETLLLLEADLAERGVHLVRLLDPALPEASLDSSQVKQVLINLVMNAIEAMPGGGQLSVRTWAQEGRVVLEVQDTGKGIEPDNLKEVFSPFFTTKKKGTGLGLAISYKIVQDHGGTIGLRSAPEKGTTATVTLPLSPPPGEPAAG
jgi:two-component system sensor kinase FixL